MSPQGSKNLESHLIQGDEDLAAIQDLLQNLLGEPTTSEMDLALAVPEVRQTIRLWRKGQNLVGFAFVDEFHNLRFETAAGTRAPDLDAEIIEWGVHCLSDENKRIGEENPLDTACFGDDKTRIQMLKGAGFTLLEVRTLRYCRSLDVTIPNRNPPPGFALRTVQGIQEAAKMAALHQAAFGTEYMTPAKRVAIMQTKSYDPYLDLLITAPNATFAAFCICTRDEADPEIGATDPIGTHPDYQRLGLASALICAGMAALRRIGCHMVELGTSSENIPMQKTAEGLGFIVQQEKLWFSKQIPSHV